MYMLLASCLISKENCKEQWEKTWLIKRHGKYLLANNNLHWEFMLFENMLYNVFHEIKIPVEYW